MGFSRVIPVIFGDSPRKVSRNRKNPLSWGRDPAKSPKVELEEALNALQVGGKNHVSLR